ncbi:MAG: PilZ domain-containing protein [Nitrospirae bacterium]|nr:PilZ domain-containing protein [Nitrospirota bacterium]
MDETERPERRKDKRGTFIKEVEVIGLGIHRCSDIGTGGLYLETVQLFPVGTQLALRFKLYDGDAQPIEVRTRVIYVHEGVGIGLGFIDLNSDDRARIVKFIEQG